MKTANGKHKSPLLTRREFLEGSAASAAALTLLPGSALADPAGPTPPGDRIKLACIGVGAQGTRVMMDFLKFPDVQVVAVCDVNRESSDYSEWGPGEIVGKERKLLNDPGWGADWKGPTCGRQPAARLVDAYYRNVRNLPNYRTCGSYNDFRELIAKESDLDGVVVCVLVRHEQQISLDVLDAVQKVARERGATPAQIACAWIMQAPGVTAPIVGATKTAHLKDIIKSVDIKLSAEEVAALEKPYRPHPILGHDQPVPARMVAGHEKGKTN